MALLRVPSLSRLNDETRARREAERRADRMSRLWSVTAALSRAHSPEDVAAATVGEGVAAMGAVAGSMALLKTDRPALEIVRAVGYPAEWIERWRHMTLEMNAPLAITARTGAPLWISSLHDLQTRFPDLVQVLGGDRLGEAFAVVPLEVEDRVLGVIGLSFAEPRAFDEEDRAFLGNLGELAAQALDRAEKQRQSRARLELLAEASRAFLDAGLNQTETLHIVAKQIALLIGDGCAVRMFTPVRDAVATPAFYHPRSEARELVAPMLAAGPVRVTKEMVAMIDRGENLLLPKLSREEQLRTTQPEVHPYIEQFGMSSVLIAGLRVRGRGIGYIGLYRDEGGRPYEEADRALLQDIADRAAMAIDNARLYEEAQRAIDARDAFLSVASHELKTPLTTLQLQFEGALRVAERLEAPLDPRIEKKLRAADNSVTRLSKLIDQLLDVSRLASGRFKLDLEPVDLGELLREVVQRFEHQIERSGSTVATRVEGDASGLWDRIRLDQVITNLISNALKFGAERPISASVRGEEDAVLLRVADQGIGIAAENLSKIFQRYERFVSSKNYAGFGLGLWISRQLIEELGGTIHVDTELGRGTVFTVKLPKAGPPRHPAGHTPR